jgi:PAS domain S-box-containing protein
MEPAPSVPAAWVERSAVVFYALRGDDGDLRATYLTGNVRELTGFELEEASAPGWWPDRLHAEDRETTLARRRERAAEVDHVDEYRIRHRDGSERWLRDRWRRASSGGGDEIVGTWIDVTDLRRREQELRASETRYRQLFDSSPHAMWVYDLETLRFLAVNDAAVARYGYSREEFATLRLTDIRPPEEVPRLLANLAAAPQRLENAGIWKHRHKDGAIREVEITSHALRFDGRPARVVLAHDRTEQLSAERALRESESSYSSLFRSVAEAIYIQDEAGRFLDVNDGAMAMYGYPRERFLGETPEFLSAPGRNDLATVAAGIGRALAGEPQRFEFWGRRANGEVFPKEVRLFPGTFRGRPAVMALAQDISERRRAESELRLLREAIEQVAEAIVVTGRDGVIQYVNPAFERITGYGRDEVLGRNTRILKSGVQPPDFYRDLWDTISSGRSWQGRIVNRRQDGTLYTEELGISPVVGETGAIAHYVAVKRDIHEQLELQERLLQSQKMESVGRLAGGVAHDFNNMLSIVLGYGELARGRIPPEHPAQEHLEQILSAAERSSTLVRQLLAFARRQPIEPQIVDLNDLLARTGKLLRGLVSEEIDLVLDLGPGLWPVRVDPGQVDQVLANLVVNSRDAIAGTGRITVATRNVGHDDGGGEAGDPPANVLLSVTDTGHGMDRATRERLFEPFFTTKGPGKGTGLGLATVYGIVQQNGGRIEVESEPGCGACLRIYLPRAEPSSEPSGEVAVPTTHEPGRGETVLLVEDSPQLLKLTGELLRRLGYRVLTAESAGEAGRLSAAAPGEIDLLLTDVVLPEANGRALAEQLAATQPRMRVVYMSGYSADIVLERGVVPRGVQFLQKPFTRETLARKIREALDG